jgi:hypothetical protein
LVRIRISRKSYSWRSIRSPQTNRWFRGKRQV